MYQSAMFSTALNIDKQIQVVITYLLIELVVLEDCMEEVGKKEDPQGRVLWYQDHKEVDYSQN